MKQQTRYRFCLATISLAAIMVAGIALMWPRQADGYIEAGYSLGRVVNESTNVVYMRVETVDRDKNLIVYRKIRDIKGTYPGDTIKHNIGKGGFNPREWATIMNLTEVGGTAVFFSNGSLAETCIGTYWYQAVAGEWWTMNHAEPYMLRTYSGRADKLAEAVAAMLENKEPIITALADGDKTALHTRVGKLMRLKASLKLMDYNPQRDFTGWGGEDFQVIQGMPGFTHYGALTRLDGGAQIEPADFDGDGKMDLLMYSPARVCLLQNTGGAFSEAPLPLETGASAAAWGDFNGDKLPDLVLATPAGPKLLINQKTKFQDASALLGQQKYWYTTAVATMDYDGDGRTDILVADGFTGLRLLRNVTTAAQESPVKMGEWSYIGPFDNPDGSGGFDKQYGPEKDLDLTHKHAGIDGKQVAWAKGKFVDGEVNSFLPLFERNTNTVVYLHRELLATAAGDLPVSFGSDDQLVVWLNGHKIISENTPRLRTNQNLATLSLKAGKNDLLVKVCQGGGDWGFYFSTKGASSSGSGLAFQDVSDKAGLGASGIGAAARCEAIVAADFNGDGRCDFLFCGGPGLLVLNTPDGFRAAADSGISFKTPGVRPAVGDINGDKLPDLFIPQGDRSRVLINAGNGRFTDATAKSGAALAGGLPAACGTWADLTGKGRLDLLVGCLRGPNRYLRNNGDGTFVDVGESLGLDRRIFNMRSIAFVDVNKDHVGDLVLANEGQDSAVLLGNPAMLPGGDDKK